MTFQFKGYKTQIICGVSIRKLYIFFNYITFNSIINNIELTIKKIYLEGVISIKCIPNNSKK